MSESEIIERVFAPLVRRAGALDLKDDCAAYSPGPGQELVLKTDPVREGVHFFAGDPPEAIGWKALAVNVSDLAAKAARPTGYLCAVSFPHRPSDAWLDGLRDGLAAAQNAFGLSVLGGDTDRAPGPISIAVTVFGECPSERMIRRGGARSGDLVYVSGALGAAAAGLAVQQGKLHAATSNAAAAEPAAKAALERYLRPQPRLGLKAALRRYASAAMDISDGLLKDATRMAAASGRKLIIARDEIPVSECVMSLALDEAERWHWALAHGDDYEVLATVAPANGDAFEALARSGGVEVRCIGRVEDGAGLIVRDQNGQTVGLEATGWDHF